MKKNILLLGDSIRMGYDKYVAMSMEKTANVFYPKENCCYATNILRNLHGWTDALELYEADAVHFNAGHWDTVRIYGDDPLTRIDVYADTLVRITHRIRFLFPGAKVIFALSTPVIEEGFIEELECRKNADVAAYNEAAKAALEKEGVVINDLYSTIADKPASYHSDQTHFYTPDATELLGQQVCRVLCRELDIDESTLTYPDKNQFTRPDVKGDREMFEKRGHIYVLKRNTDGE